MKAIRLVPVSGGDGRDTAVLVGHMDLLAADLAHVFGVNCHVETRALDASFAFDAQRGQYHSTAILQRLPEAPDTHVLGVAAVDLFVPVLTFVFGEAQIAGTRAVVSVIRLREEFYGLPRNDFRTQQRLAKEAIHELGHAHGLRHCDDWRCVMSSTHSVEYLDLKQAAFCGECRERIA